MSSQEVNDPLHRDLLEAVDNGTVEDVRRLLKAGADPLCESSDGFTPLEKAAQSWNYEALSEMFDHGVSVDWQDSKGRSLLHFAAEDGLDENAVFLLEKGADVDLTDENGNTPLHNTAINDCPETAQVLLVNSADPAALNHKGKTPLDLCRADSDIFALLYAIRTHGKVRKFTDSLAGGINQPQGPGASF